jgi:hypothetical protein
MIRLEHPAGQLGLGGEADPVGDTGGPAACRIVNPVLGQVQLAVDHPMPSLSCVGQVDGDRGVVDLAGGAGVLTVHPDGVAALLEVAGLVDHQHRGGVSQVQVGLGEQYAPHRPGDDTVGAEAGQPVAEAAQPVQTERAGGDRDHDPVGGRQREGDPAGQARGAAPWRTCRTAAWMPPVHGSPCPGSTSSAARSSRRARDATAWAASAVKGATCGPRAPVVTA